MSRSDAELASAIESILLVAAEPVSSRTLTRLLEVDSRRLDQAVDFLIADGAGRGIRLQIHDGRFQLTTAPENAELVREFLRLPRQPRISRPSLETLAVIAYRQPVTRLEIEQVRGVNVDRIMANLVARGWIAETGRRNTPGRPIEYGTTGDFLEIFGLSSLDELPELGSDVELSVAQTALGMQASAPETDHVSLATTSS